MFCTPPIRLSGISNLTGTPFRKSEFHQVLYPCFRFLPLFPDVHPKTSAQPAVPFFHRVAHTCDSEVAKPSAGEYFNFLHHHADVSALTAGSQFFQLLLCFLQGLCMGADKHSASPLSECKAQELKISLCVHTYNFALFPIHLELELSFKIISAGFEQTPRRSRRSGKHDDVVSIPNHMYSPALHLVVKFIEIDVGKKRTERSSLWGTFFCPDVQSVFHDPAFQELLDEFNHAPVMDFFPHHVHQQVMVQRVKVFGQVYKHCLLVSLFRIFLHFLNCHLRASARSVAVAPVREQWFVDWGQLLGDCLLDDTVYDCWNSKCKIHLITARI